MTRNDAASPHVLVDALLEVVHLPSTSDHDCPYLPDRQARNEMLLVQTIDPQLYSAMMDRGFRRDGRVVYRPVCRRCHACRQIRVRVAAFTPSRSQRRVWRRNQNLRVTVGRPKLTDAKWRLFAAYLDFQHDGVMSRTKDSMAEFLYQAPVPTVEICYFLGDELVAVSMADRLPRALSSVYVYFAPQHARRSPGTFSVLWEIEYCRREGIPYYYLGYYVPGARTMDYKIRFRPCEILDRSHSWIRQPTQRPTPVEAG